ncbi:hypothetical protein [Asticcacaulis sp. EMRT-3]|uniref:hypothetical protein n=1 Tax=Asticcacaulis sp. EMRT-3 TaxID=3040349 RepID=UPI0024AFEC40|nr:hypothetical protein [Asticcacaulis sp. EMRT-3]MDI7774034.1 hypothetical protein [Asticcacaulis sp. EMRT-3]
MNFGIKREKANKINGSKIRSTGLNQTDSKSELSRPTGGTSTVFQDDFPLKYSTLNAFSASVSAHCSSGLYHFDSFKQPITSTVSIGNAENDCSIKLYHQAVQDRLESKSPQPSVSVQKGSFRSAGSHRHTASKDDGR